MHRCLAVGSALAACGATAVPAIAQGEERERRTPGYASATVEFRNRQNVELGRLSFVGPFARLEASRDPRRGIVIGEESDVQDNAILSTRRGRIRMGDQAVVAHGGIVNGPASIGVRGTCPARRPVCPSFVGFNANVDRAVVQQDAMVLTLARVAPGVTIPSGRKVLPGKNVRSSSEIAAKTAPVTDADREFMAGVVEVNVEFARRYRELRQRFGVRGSLGINAGPRGALPILNGRLTRDPEFRNRIIGRLSMANSKGYLDEVMGNRISIRADEGEFFEIGRIDSMGNHVTMHALENSPIRTGDSGGYNYRSIVHGGPTPFENLTITGDDVLLRARSVLFRSRVGADSVIGFKSLVQQSDLPAGTEVPSRTVVIENRVAGRVEW